MLRACLTVLVAVVTLVVEQTSGIPGEWRKATAAKSESINLANLRWVPYERTYLIFGVQSCTDVIFTLGEQPDSNGQYLLFYLGYYSNSYALIIPSSDCDSSGSCAINHYSQGNYLSCDELMFFWVSWDTSGNAVIGSGYTPGANVLILIDTGLTAEAHHADFLFNDDNGGILYIFVDNPPKVLNPAADGTTVLEMTEFSTLDTVLFTLEGFDDLNDPISLHLWEHTDVFAVEGMQLKNIGPLDYEEECSYTLNIQMHDNFNSVNTTLTIRLLNAFDEAPSVDAMTVSIPEELTVDTFIDGGYTIGDIDEGDKLTYSLSGSHSSYFEMTTDGRIKVAARMNFDPPDSLRQLDQVTLTVTDLGSNTNSTTLTFEIVDVNDNKPIFSKSVYNAEVTEGSGTVSLLQLTVTDDDTGVNGEYDVTLDGYDATDPKFTLDPGTLQLSAHADNLDYENMEPEGFIYRLSFMATDRATDFQPLTGTAVAIITILPANEHTPVWTTAPADQTVSETTDPWSTLGQYTATDDDLSKDGDVAYEITDVQDDQGVQHFDIFHLDSGTGAFILASPLDYDSATGGTTHYDVTVKAADGGASPKNVETTFRISVGPENDNAPVFEDSLYQTTAAEDIGVNTAVLSVVATDADGDTLTYTVTGEGQGTFDYTTDIINVKTLDFEDHRCYTFTLKASDGVHETEVSVNVNVLNVIDETPILTVTSPLTLIEELPVGTPLGGVYDVTDKDENDTLTYSLEGTESSYFSIDSSTGVISVAQRIDRDAGVTSITQVTLKVTDAGGNTASEPLSFTIVDINDNSPQFSSDVIYVDLTENTASDTLLKSLVVTDDDDGDNADVVVSIIDGDDANPNEKFKIDTLDLKTHSTLVDYETLSGANFQYTLTVQAVDQSTTESQRKGFAAVIVTVFPVNEYSPEWAVTPADMSLSESLNPGTFITRYTATENDIGADGDVTYRLVQVFDNTGTNGSDRFHLDSGNGDFILTSPLDADSATGGVDYYDVTMTAVDGGASPKSVETTFRISIGGKNDNAPVFSENLYQAIVSEDVNINTGILTATVTDADGDVISYTINGEGTGTFDYTTDLLTLVALDYEEHRCYTFKLAASDGLHVTEVAVNINVSNVFDEVPVLAVNSPHTLLEELPVGTPLAGVYNVTDRDEDDTLTFVLEGTESSYFSIDSTTGVIFVAQRIDRDAGLTSITQVTLKVTDAGGNTASEPLSFTIVDINDNTPQFSSDVIYVNVTENTPADQIILTLTCTDADDGDNAALNFAIKSGDVAPDRFKLQGKDIQTTSQAVNYEDPDVPGNMYSLTVTATDTPTTGNSKTAFVTVIVTVLPENEFSPAFTHPTLSETTLSETTLAGYVVDEFVGTDDDNGDDGQLVYEIASVTDPFGNSVTSKFFIEEVSGKLRVAEALDFDSATGGVDYLYVTVKVSDKGSSAKSEMKDYKVILQNENDIAPVFLGFSSIIDIPENTNIGDVIITLTTQDDDGDSVTANIVDGDTSLFSVAGSDITLQQALDFETAVLHMMIISITDGVHTVNNTLAVRVTDVIDEKPVLETFSPVYVTEELPVGTEVDGLYNVTDLDRGDSFTFALTGSDSSYFSINSTSGQITISQRIDLEALAGDNVLDQLTLTVEDQAGLQATASLSVEILDINDNYPTFSQSVYKVNISESSSTEVLIDLVCTDADSGTNGDITMQISDGDDPDSSKFQLSGTELSALGADLDYEALESTQYMFILTMSATDAPVNESPKTGVTLVVVSVSPVNEHKPVWASALSVSGGALPDMTMLENVTVGSDLLTLEATDADHGSDGVVSYHISSVTTNTGASASELFSVDSTSGILRSARQLDRDITTGDMYYTLVLEARDGGNPSKDTSATLKITLENVNDNVPVFSTTDYVVSVPETTAAGTVIHTFASAEDLDRDAITYSVTGDASTVFSITGLDLKLLVPLDFETERCYSVIVEASDGLYKDSVVMTVLVKDVIDEKPVITAHNPIIIPEELPVGTRISWVINVTDADKGDALKYSITGTDANYFSMDPDNGALTMAQVLDREVKATLDDLTVHVEDTGVLTDDVILSINVLDINDAIPTFDSDVHVVYVIEGGVEVDLVNLVVTDQDDGDNAKYDVTITSGNDGGEFRLDGMILKGDTSMMDYDTSAVSNYTYVLTVQAVDKPTKGASLTGETVVVVHIGPRNEFDPAWVSPTPVSDIFPSVTVTESATPLTTSLVTYIASDGDSGAHGQITYSIVSASTAEGDDASGMFLLSPVDGDLWMTKYPDADVATGGTSSYDIVIMATDGGQRSIQATQTINVTNINDNAPVISTSAYATEVAESSSTGTTIFSLNVSDFDGDTTTSTVIQGGNYFDFDGTSVTIKNSLDFEMERCHTVVISASDGVHDVNVTLTVNVTDVNDNPPEVTLHKSVSIPEELPVGTIIGGVYDATDKDEGDSLTFSLSGSDDNLIQVDTKGELKIKSTIDRDGTTGVTFLDDLTLTVTDSSGHNTVVSLNISIVDVNDNPPVCSPSVIIINVTENSADGLIAKLNCTDKDDGDNGVFVLSIIDGNDLSYISLSNLDVHAAGSSIDYEALDTSVPYIVTVKAVDQPTTEAAKSADISLIIQVLPQNEHSPVWQSPSVDGSGNFPTQILSETTAPGTVVVTVTATDADAGTDGDVTYDILSATDNSGANRISLFIIDQSQGILRTLGELDKDQPDGIGYLDLIIRATDGGSVAKTTTGRIIIDVSGENDNPPVFTDLPTDTYVAEDSVPGTLILNLQASDIDGDTVDFELSGSDAHLFKIVGSDLELKQALNYEETPCLAIVLTANDGGHTTNASVTIKVVDVVDETPQITLSSPLLLPEELPVGVAVGGFFSVNDLDVGDNLTYSLTGTGADYFVMNSTGEMFIAKRVDRDSPGDVTLIDGLTLTVTDTSGLKDDMTLKFTIVDINDNIPVCSVTPTQVNVTENTGEDELLAELTCTDADDGDYGTFTMALDTASDPNNHFKLSGTQLQTDANPTDYESVADTKIRVLVKDNPGGVTQNTATTVINVKVLPLNEHSPVFTTPAVDASGDFSDITLPEDTTIGATVVTFTASDDDHGDDGDVTYSIAGVETDSGTDAAGLFTIDSSTGELRLTGQLDADVDTGGVSFYIVNITAMDSGASSLSTQGALRILVTGTNDNPPEWNISLLEVEVYENTSVGNEVFSLTVTDVDGDTVTVTTSDTMFEIDGTKVKVKQQLDFEQERCYTFTVSASDGKYIVNETFAFHVLDSNDESPVVTVTMAMSVPEEISVGTGVARGYIVTDGDENDVLSYSLEGTESSLLAINSSTGEITVNDRMDFESLSSPGNLDITLRVTDSVGHTVTHPLNLAVTDVNDNAPVFSQAVNIVTVTENAAGETLLIKLKCTDADAGDNGKFSFNISDGNNAGLFRLDGDDLYVQVVDYEAAESLGFMYSLTIIAVDHAVKPKTAATVVIVEILAVNEFDPEWKNPAVDGSGHFPALVLSESVVPGHEVIKVTATDKDLGEDGHVVYKIDTIVSDTGVNADNLFTISSLTGVLSTSSQLDFDQTTAGANYYDVTVTASDRGNQSRSTTAVQRVELNNYNDIPPVFTEMLYKVNVACSSAVGQKLTTLSADDGDSGSSIEYGIESGTNAYVSVASSGEVSLKSRPAGTSVTDLAQSVSIVASDKGTPELKVLGRLLVLFENCANATSCENVTATTAAPTTTTATTTTKAKTTAATTATRATTGPTTHANCSTPVPCTSSPPCEGMTEAWVMRALVMALALALLGSVIFFLRPRLPKPPLPPRKVFPQPNSMERGISDDPGKRFNDDIEHHFLHK